MLTVSSRFNYLCNLQAQAAGMRLSKVAYKDIIFVICRNSSCTSLLKTANSNERGEMPPFSAHSRTIATISELKIYDMCIYGHIGRTHFTVFSHKGKHFSCLLHNCTYIYIYIQSHRKDGRDLNPL